MERTGNSQGDRKRNLPWWKLAGVICLFIFSISLIAFSASRLVDETCSTDKVSLEKRCVKAIDHYKGQHVNF